MFRFFRQLRQRLLPENRFSKYLLYAIGEILLVVIGILIALQVDNWNTDRKDQQRMEKYAKALILDLRGDIEMIRVSQFQAMKNFRKIDSLRNYFLATNPQDISNTDLFVLTHDIMYRPYKWNRATLEEIKASGSLRDISNDTLKKRIIEYESFSYHLDEDFEFDKSNSERAEQLIAEVVYLNTPYFDEMLELEAVYFNDPDLDLFDTSVYKKSKENDHALTSYDPSLINTFLNTFIQIQGQYRIRAFMEMPQILKDAKEIIQMMQEEYNL